MGRFLSERLQVYRLTRIPPSIRLTPHVETIQKQWDELSIVLIKQKLRKIDDSQIVLRNFIQHSEVYPQGDRFRDNTLQVSVDANRHNPSPLLKPPLSRQDAFPLRSQKTAARRRRPECIYRVPGQCCLRSGLYRRPSF